MPAVSRAPTRRSCAPTACSSTRSSSSVATSRPAPRSSGWSTSSRTSARTRASRTSASCTATSRARRQALELAASAGGEAPENVAYVQTLLGNLELADGRGEQARRAYRQALVAVPGYAGARSGSPRSTSPAGEREPAMRSMRAAVGAQRRRASTGRARGRGARGGPRRRRPPRLRAGQRAARKERRAGPQPGRGHGALRGRARQAGRWPCSSGACLARGSERQLGACARMGADQSGRPAEGLLWARRCAIRRRSSGSPGSTSPRQPRAGAAFDAHGRQRRQHRGADSRPRDAELAAGHAALPGGHTRWGTTSMLGSGHRA